MVIGGLQKNSLIDFPGKVSCVLFFSGCNFDCPYCHNPELSKGEPQNKSFLSEEHIFSFLASRRGLLDGVVFSGGEPTIQDDLLSICEKVKQLGYSVKVDTNGSRPEVIRHLLKEGFVDYIAMDIKTDPFDYSPVIKNEIEPDDIFSSIRIIMASAINYEFRTTCIRPFVNESVVERIAQYIKGSMLYALQRFHPAVMLHPEFFQNNEIGYNDQKLNYLKSIAEPWVDKCIIR
ncbi:MAG: anaerobic ribonucleoside-triphosphate reductase activating protein [Desulfobacterales bacterium]|jgi:pyruvate formate lyase activating enzyme|nr:anaerobic ribonucleoside-triphosphate reductase activating protein [Desulfobacter sp.]MDP6683332.1 anaerobic ribonucleoside-triphosphate reductase activating protein [Desulfobacterales bacterium]MDP6808965.1 anaerobic ribonucleoside-triphosphate reductase activating protein [Desulfobacterales bacterium]|tara:strand:- start:4562 stop:5260 length:699 start_codon:yes stop_codon:yes gene_type:complete